MRGRTHFSTVVAVATLCLGTTARAQLPTDPPVPQTIGVPDIAASELVEADCRICHDSGVRDRHHILYGEPIPPGSFVPFPDADRDGQPDTVYGCLNCHGSRFTVVRNCIACHTESAHHSSQAALSGDCVSCHGDIVDNMDDGHYIPDYEPSLSTPMPSDGTGEPLNSRGVGAGGCDYCHDNDGMAVPFILTNKELHHAPGFDNCLWCHPIHVTPRKIRVCEGCHGPDSLHNIQADSPNPANLGTIVFGEEFAGYGHVGKDGDPGDSDCWGCHGFSAATAPTFGPIIPTIHSSDRNVLRAGTDSLLILNGAAFLDVTGGVPSESEVAVTAADGTSVTLTPELVTDEGILVTIPGDTGPGNYALRAVKADVQSNPAVVSVIPKVTISEATCNGTVTIRGSGFSGYADSSGTSVTRPRSWGWGRWARTTAVEARIVSWTDNEIVADFGAAPREVTVNSVFGKATAKATSPKPAGNRSATALFGSATVKAKTSKPAGGTKARRRTRGGWWWW